MRIDDAIGSELGRLADLASRDHGLTGLPTGFRDLDEITGGLQPGNLILIAARPGIGKSGLVTNIAVDVAARQRRPVLFFSLEMSKAELAQRVLAAQASVDSHKLLHARLDRDDWTRLAAATTTINDAPLYLHDAARVTPTEIRARARQLHLHHQDDAGLALVIVDYLQLLHPERRSDTRTEEVGAFSRGLKQLAGELGCPVIALSQLNRQVETRHDKRPQLCDLRDSGELEQDAHLVMLLYRDDCYDADSPRPARPSCTSRSIVAVPRGERSPSHSASGTCGSRTTDTDRDGGIPPSRVRMVR